MLHTIQARPAQAPSPNTEVREQIKTSILAAQDAAREAARDAAIAAQDAARASGGNVTMGPVLAPPMPPGGYTGQPIRGNDGGIPPQAVDMAIGFFVMCAVIAIGWPLARAFGRRIERRTDVPAINPAIMDQLHRIEQAVDTMAVEVERISESQRFIARLQNAQTPERVALPADRS